VDYLTAYKQFWVNYIDFEGVTSREGYWKVFLINVIISFVLSALALFPVLTNFVTAVDTLWGLATLIPSLSIAARRLHDTNRSAFNLFWLLLPLAGWIIVIVLLAQPATEEKYGSSANNQQQ
jgi:uncharacterized membrane protein YhaH (DUF805 family)